MNTGDEIAVEVVMAWPRRFVSVMLKMPPDSTIADAVELADLPDTDAVTGYALHGIKATASALLSEGDRVELLRPLQMDPKDARRRRALGKILDPKTGP